ncbi:MAG: glutathione peroxidase [Planctomycetota bacterium]
MSNTLLVSFLAPAALFLAACGSTEPSAQEPSGEESSAEASETTDGDSAAPAADSVYALSSETLAGDAVDLERYQGKVTLFVNVASRCGYTPQYEGLQALHQAQGGDGFAVVGVPSNDFGGQEPGTADEIQAFCQENYGVSFDMLAKQSTKEGASPLFDRLADLTGERPSWNFCKYVVSADGTKAQFFPSSTRPDSPELAAAIAELAH